MELYEVTVEYVKYLRKFEPTKIMSNADGKEQRKFLGVIVQKNGYKYVIPLSSPKYKKDYKIRDYQGENLPEDFSFVAYSPKSGSGTQVVHKWSPSNRFSLKVLLPNYIFLKFITYICI